MSTATQIRLRPSVVQAKQRLTEVREKLHRQHASGTPGIQVCNLMTDLLDSVVLDVYRSALSDLGEEGESKLGGAVSLVAHGGYGRRDAAPFSDIDVMLLCDPTVAGRVQPLARRLLADLGDTRLQVGFSVRTPLEACNLAGSDPTIFTTLAEARYLAGNEGLLERFQSRFRRLARRSWRSLVHQIDGARRSERRQFGETVYLLEPNIKRSRGALRDLQLIRWIGFARYGERDNDSLFRLGVITQTDRRVLRKALEFLLRLRNEMHFSAGRTYDVLYRHDQQRIAELYGYQGEEGMLPVEQFMRDYFLHTGGVRNVMANFLAGARPRTFASTFEPLISRREGRRYRVGPVHIRATREGLANLKGNLEEVLQLMALANHSQTRIEQRTWESIREDMLAQPVEELTPGAAAKFLELIARPGRLGEQLRRLHELRVLEKIIPGMAHARGLLQFNQYHKFTVDEHCLRAVEAATEFLHDDGLLGTLYLNLMQIRTLHLALLLHDLGKGYPEDHSQVGKRLAAETAQRLGLPAREAETLEFLVEKHLRMFHLATRRDPNDEEQVVRFAVEVGSPDVLQMLYVLTCADLASVGPGVLNSWKQEMLTDLFHHAMQHLGTRR